MSTSAPSGVYVPPDTYAVDETSSTEALRFVMELACKSAERHLDSVDWSVSAPVDGEHVVTLNFWPVRVETRKQFADSLIALADELLK